LIYVSAPGVSNARNIGIERAVGDFIAFVDDDDLLSPSYFEELLHISTSSQVGLSNMKCFYDGKNDFYFDDYISRNYKRMRSLSRISFLSARRHMSGPVCKIIHRDIALSQRFNVNFKNGEDGLYMFAVSNHIKSFAITSKDAIYYRRVREDSASNKNRFKTNLQISVPIFVAYVKIWIKDPYGYNFMFFITRLLSIFKGIVYSIFK
jgi:glycosyltransferase involved in cell wall biosynthesis